MRLMILKPFLFFMGLVVCSTSAMGQEHENVSDRLVYSSSAETLPKGVLALRASIRFGNIGGVEGGAENAYGLDELQDSYLGFHLGVTDKIQVGLSRTKGSGVQRQLLNGELKINVLEQSDSTAGVPISITFSHITTGSVQFASRDSESMTYFEDVAHRMSYASQLIIHRKYSSAFSLQALAGYQHRNIAPVDENNGMFYAGLAADLHMGKRWSLLFDGIYPISEFRSRDLGYYPVLGLGIAYQRPCGDQWILELANARGLTENDFIPYSQSDFREGEIRIGLTFIKPFSLYNETAK